MQAAQLRDGDDPRGFRRLNWPRLWCVFVQSQVRSGPVIIVQKTLKMSMQAAFVEHDQVIQSLPADGSKYLIDMRTLPRRRLAPTVPV
jgi:hypothetical protein